MESYKELYFQLFAAVSDAIDALEASNHAAARELLIATQINTESQYMNGDFEEWGQPAVIHPVSTRLCNTDILSTFH